MAARTGTSLGAILHGVEAQLRKSCDTDVGGCGVLNEIELSLTRAPPAVFTVQLAWESQQESPVDIVDTLVSITGVRSLLTCAQDSGRERPHSTPGTHGEVVAGNDKGVCEFFFFLAAGWNSCSTMH